jgi:hypothetical protein
MFCPRIALVTLAILFLGCAGDDWRTVRQRAIEISHSYVESKSIEPLKTGGDYVKHDLMSDCPMVFAEFPENDRPQENPCGKAQLRCTSFEEYDVGLSKKYAVALIPGGESALACKRIDSVGPGVPLFQVNARLIDLLSGSVVGSSSFVNQCQSGDETINQQFLAWIVNFGCSIDKAYASEKWRMLHP